MQWEMTAKKGLRGAIRPPSDKSLTHRSILFSALAKGECIVENPLMGEDCLASLRAMNALGLRHEWIDEKRLRLLSFFPWTSSVHHLDCGNSGTSIRLLAGLIAGRSGVDVTLDGDASLRKRPMKRVAEPLRLMGASIEGDQAPLHVVGKSLHGIDYASTVASAQVKSAILLAGLTAEGVTRASEPTLSRDHTERMLAAMGAPIRRLNETTVEVERCDKLNPFEINVPGDISSAAFWLVAACLVPGSEITLTEVGINPTRSGILDVLAQVGVEVELSNETVGLGEPRADLTIRTPERLTPFVISGDLVPRLIDEIPILSLLATQCDGVSEVRDAQELRVKESNRIDAMVKGLRAMGSKVEAKDDGLVIEGPNPLVGATIESNLDHRIAMTFAIAGLIAEGTTTIDGVETVSSSYPDFINHLNSLCN